MVKWVTGFRNNQRRILSGRQLWSHLRYLEKEGQITISNSENILLFNPPVSSEWILLDKNPYYLQPPVLYLKLQKNYELQYCDYYCCQSCIWVVFRWYHAEAVQDMRVYFNCASMSVLLLSTLATSWNTTLLVEKQPTTKTSTISLIEITQEKLAYQKCK